MIIAKLCIDLENTKTINKIDSLSSVLHKLAYNQIEIENVYCHGFNAANAVFSFYFVQLHVHADNVTNSGLCQATDASTHYVNRPETVDNPPK